MSQITHDTEVATKADLAEFYQRILPYLNGSPMDYSTEEKVVGTWIDGRPVYQKTFEFGQLGNVSTWTDFGAQDIGASVDKVIASWGILFTNSGTCGQIPYAAGSSGVFINHGLNSNTGALKNKVSLCYNGSFTWITKSYATIQYTKTTD